MASPFTPRRKFSSAYIVALISLIVVGGATLAFLATRDSSGADQTAPAPTVATDGQGTDPDAAPTPQITQDSDVVVNGTPAGDLGPTPRPTPSARNSTVIHKQVVSGVPTPVPTAAPMPTPTPDLARDSADTAPAVTPAPTSAASDSSVAASPSPSPVPVTAVPPGSGDTSNDNSPYDPTTPTKPAAPAGGAPANGGGY